jgi:hypothetical protein
LVLASVEKEFDPDRDKVFHLELAESAVELREMAFSRLGDVDSWLSSLFFGLRQPRSLDAENAIENAKRVQLLSEPTIQEITDAQLELEQTLGAHDAFWPRWRSFAQRHGVDD